MAKKTVIHPVMFVGAGPGDPELITVKGQKALLQADLIIYAGYRCHASAPGLYPGIS